VEVGVVGKAVAVVAVAKGNPVVVAMAQGEVEER